MARQQAVCAQGGFAWRQRPWRLWRVPARFAENLRFMLLEEDHVEDTNVFGTINFGLARSGS